MVQALMNAKCTADHDSPDSMLPRDLCLTCNPRKRKTVPRESKPSSGGVTLAPPLSVYKAIAAELSDESEKQITTSAEEAMAKIGPKEALLRQQREATVTTNRRQPKVIVNAKTNAPVTKEEVAKRFEPKTANTVPAETEAATQESQVRSNTAKKTTAKKTAAKSSARKAVKSTAARTSKGERKTYDWNGAKEKAATGIIPPAPDFSAHTHRFYREPLAEAVKLVKAGDVKALQALKFTRDDGSPGMIKRYRDIALIALKAKK